MTDGAREASIRSPTTTIASVQFPVSRVHGVWCRDATRCPRHFGRRL